MHIHVEFGVKDIRIENCSGIRILILYRKRSSTNLFKEEDYYRLLVICCHMDTDEELLDKISRANMTYTLQVDDQIFILENVSLTKSKIPVRKPTTRGGVYFTDTSAYKIKATTNDLSIIELLPKLMLGPNTEFRSLEVKTSYELDETKKCITLVTHIANTMNTKNTVELNLIVDKINLN